MAELVDATDLKSVALGRVGSSPTVATFCKLSTELEIRGKLITTPR